MKFINEILEYFQNLSLENIIDIGIGLAIIVIFKIFSSVFAYIIIKMFKFKVKDKKKIKENAFYKPLTTFFVVLGIYICAMELKLPENIFYFITKIFKICIILLTAKGFANLFDSNSYTFNKLCDKIKVHGTDTTLNFLSKVIKFLIYIIAGFIVISELGYDLSGLITGLGISSVVIALAAQDIAKSMLAGFSIISDRPFDIGDNIEVDKYSGTVEDITFRTTRIRDMKNQIVILPNSYLTSTSIINVTKREKRKYNLTLTLAIDTSIEKLISLTENIKEALKTHPDVIQDDIQVFFDTISDNGINISINFYTSILDTKDFLVFKEEINYILLEIINKGNLKLASTFKSVYLKKE